MAKSQAKKEIETKRPSLSMNIRNYIVLAFMILIALAIIAHMAFIQLVQGDDWLSRARAQQMSDNVVPAKRGTIYDANMEPLAVSADVWRLIMSPKDIQDIDLDDFEDIATLDQLREHIADELSALLSVDREKLLKQTKKIKGDFYCATREC